MPTIFQQKNLLTKAFYDYKKSLERYSLFKVNNADIGQDLVQETFLKTWMYLVRGGKIETMKAFLYHVLNDLIIDKYRKHHTVSLDALVEIGFDPREEDPENIINRLDSKIAASTIKLLPVKYRQLMHMKYVKNMSLEEMAKATGQSKNTVAVQTNRGLQKLKAIYNGQKTPHIK